MLMLCEGALVPISPGAMRNDWFPRGIAAYVTAPELKRLRLSNAPIARDFQFGMPTPEDEQGLPDDANAIWQKDIPGDIKGMTNAELRNASAIERAKIETGQIDADSTALRKVVEVEKLTPERSMELVELFVPPRLEFYRQPIVEEKEPEKPAPERTQYGGAAGDLLAARTPQTAKSKEKPQAIYGSVSAHDVLVAMRAVMAGNDEAARVILQESDIQLIDLQQAEGSEAGRLKHIGDFVMEIKVKGVEKAIQRTVRINPQED